MRGGFAQALEGGTYVGCGNKASNGVQKGREAGETKEALDDQGVGGRDHI